ncbi:hypothetical protein KW791_04055 [Candidatus Parcubacteria bacterium]|nr:hypothetical protein [Candidatus Parcubacteria bacterium]
MALRHELQEAVRVFKAAEREKKEAANKTQYQIDRKTAEPLSLDIIERIKIKSREAARWGREAETVVINPLATSGENQAFQDLIKEWAQKESLTVDFDRSRQNYTIIIRWHDPEYGYR